MAELRKRLIKSGKNWKLWVFGTVVLLGTLLGYLQTLGITTGHSGNMFCGADKVCTGEFFINVPSSVTNYLGQQVNITQLCFGKDLKIVLTKPEIVNNLGLYRADNRYRTDNPARWKPFNFTGSCIPVGNNSFMINATKDAKTNVKWAIEGTDIDPTWYGYEEVFKNMDVEISNLTSIPGIKLYKWNGETFLDVRFSTTKTVNKTSITAEKVKYEYDTVDVNLYPINITDVGVEFELNLKQKPASNKFYFNITALDANFYYQPPLNVEYPNASCNATNCCYKGECYYRPEDIVGSYAVYSKTKRDNQYETGKMFQIYRPKICDADNKCTWGVLNISNNVMTITITQSFLNSAKYPVVVDPSFGYTTNGASTITTDSRYRCKYDIPAANGTLTSISAAYATAVSENVQLGLYNATSNTAGNLLSNTTLINPTVNGWNTANVITASTLKSSQYYQICAVVVTADFKHDTGGASGNSVYTTDTAINPMNVTLAATVTTNIYSIFANYTSDTTIPTYSNVWNNVTNNTVVGPTVIGFGAQWNDNALSTYIISNNTSGSWANGTATSFAVGNWTNSTIDTSGITNGAVFQMKIYGTDTSGNQNVTGIWQYTKDGTAPTYSLNSTNSTLAGTPVKHNLNWTDNIGLSGYIFQFCNGTWNGTYCLEQCNSTTTISILPNTANSKAFWANMNNIYSVEYGNCSGIDAASNPYQCVELTDLNYSYVNSSNNIRMNTTLSSAGQQVLTQQNYQWNISAYAGNINYINITTEGWGTSTGGGLAVRQCLLQNDTSNSTVIWSMPTSEATSIYNITSNIDSWLDGTNTLYIKCYSRTSASVSASSANLFMDLVNLTVNYNISVSGTCGWANDSFVPMTGLTNWSNVTKVVNSTVGANIAWCVYANDTSNNWNSTSCSNPFSYLTTSASDSTAPTYSKNVTNATLNNTPCLFKLEWNDDQALQSAGQYIFSTNNSGAWANASAVNFTATPENATNVTTLNSTNNTLVGWRFYAFDNAGNWNASEIFYLTTTAAAGVVSTCDDFDTTGLLDCADDCVNTTITVAGDLHIYSTGPGTANLTDIKVLGDLYENYTDSCYVYWYGYKNITG